MLLSRWRDECWHRVEGAGSDWSCSIELTVSCTRRESKSDGREDSGCGSGCWLCRGAGRRRCVAAVGNRLPGCSALRGCGERLSQGHQATEDEGSRDVCDRP